MKILRRKIRFPQDTLQPFAALTSMNEAPCTFRSTQCDMQVDAHCQSELQAFGVPSSQMCPKSCLPLAAMWGSPGHTCPRLWVHGRTRSPLQTAKKVQRVPAGSRQGGQTSGDCAANLCLRCIPVFEQKSTRLHSQGRCHMCVTLRKVPSTCQVACMQVVCVAALHARTRNLLLITLATLSTSSTTPQPFKQLHVLLTQLIPAMHILCPYLDMQLGPPRQAAACVVHVQGMRPNCHISIRRLVNLCLAAVQSLYQFPASSCMHAPLHGWSAERRSTAARVQQVLHPAAAACQAVRTASAPCRSISEPYLAKYTVSFETRCSHKLADDVELRHVHRLLLTSIKC